MVSLVVLTTDGSKWLLLLLTALWRLFCFMVSLVVLTTDGSKSVVLVLVSLVVFTTDRSMAVVLLYGVIGSLYY